MSNHSIIGFLLIVEHVWTFYHNAVQTLMVLVVLDLKIGHFLRSSRTEALFKLWWSSFKFFNQRLIGVLFLFVFLHQNCVSVRVLSRRALLKLFTFKNSVVLFGHFQTIITTMSCFKHLKVFFWTVTLIFFEVLLAWGIRLNTFRLVWLLSKRTLPHLF